MFSWYSVYYVYDYYMTTSDYYAVGSGSKIPTGLPIPSGYVRKDPTSRVV